VCVYVCVCVMCDMCVYVCVCVLCAFIIIDIMCDIICYWYTYLLRVYVCVFVHTHTHTHTHTQTDGDTPQGTRERIVDNALVFLTNPDMLHVNMLPRHHQRQFKRLFSSLSIVVIDEAHVYTGVCVCVCVCMCISDMCICMCVCMCSDMCIICTQKIQHTYH